MTTHVVFGPPSLLSAFFDSVSGGEVEATVAVFDAGRVEAVVVFESPRLLDDVDISGNMSWYIRRRAIARSGPRAALQKRRGRN